MGKVIELNIPDITTEQSDAILLTLQENGYIAEEDIPDHSLKRIAVADYWIDEARKTLKSNPSFAKSDEAIRTILNIAGYPEKEEEEIYNHKLPIPREPDFEYNHLPADFTELTDREIRKFSSHNQHFLNRARYLLAQVSNHQANATHLRDDAYRNAYIKYNDELEAAGERTTKDLINSYATRDEEYKRYDKDVKEATAEITSLKALVEIYSGNVERLSREWTMRQNEWEKGR